MATTLDFVLYHEDRNTNAGHGTIELSGPDQSGWYVASVISMMVNGKPGFQPEDLKGPSSACGGTTSIELVDSQREDLKMLLYQNPFAADSFSGFTAYEGDSYTLTAVGA